MIVQVEFDRFTRVSEYVKEHPILLRTETNNRRFSAEPASGSSMMWQQEPANAAGYAMAELKVAG